MTTINTEHNSADGYDPGEGLFKWVTNQSYYPRNLIAVVLRNFKPEADGQCIMADTARALIELHPVRIKGFHTGFQNGLTLPIRPEFWFNEKYGRPIDRFFTTWFNNHHSGLAPHKEDPDDGTIDVMFIEPDPTHLKVVAAWYVFHMRPLTYNGIEGKRDLTRSNHKRIKRGVGRTKMDDQGFKGFVARRRLYDYVPIPTTLHVEFSGNVNIGAPVDEMAQRILNGISLQSVNPYAQRAFNNDWIEPKETPPKPSEEDFHELRKGLGIVRHTQL